MPLWITPNGRPMLSEIVSSPIAYARIAAIRRPGNQPRASRRAGEPAVVINSGQAHPAFVALAVDKRLAGFALRLQRIEFLLERAVCR